MSKEKKLYEVETTYKSYILAYSEEEAVLTELVFHTPNYNPPEKSNVFPIARIIQIGKEFMDSFALDQDTLKASDKTIREILDLLPPKEHPKQLNFLDSGIQDDMTVSKRKPGDGRSS